MRVLLFQHHDDEGPGTLGQFLRDDGGEIETVHFTHGDPIPDLGGFDQLWIMGGPMDVWDLDEHPWLAPEKAAIRTFVRDIQKPVLGVCLGHQLLADALGGTCGPLSPPEIGVVPMTLTDRARTDPLLAGLEKELSCVQWHGVHVAQLPDGAEGLASSRRSRVQAARYGPCAWGLQGHVEVEPHTVRGWGAIAEYRAALDALQGPGAIDRFDDEAQARMSQFKRTAETLYRNLSQLSR